MTQFGEILKSWRMSRQLSMTDAAEKAGISVSAWSKLESDTNNPTKTTCEGIAKALNIPVEEVFQAMEISGQKSNDNSESEYISTTVEIPKIRERVFYSDYTPDGFAERALSRYITHTASKLSLNKIETTKFDAIVRKAVTLGVIEIYKNRLLNIEAELEELLSEDEYD